MPNAVAPPTAMFWANDKRGLDPKRSHRFILYLNDVPSYFVMSTGVPTMSVGQGGTHKFLGHEFKFPGSVKWEGDITVKLVDTIDINMAKKFSDYIRKAGYVYPSTFSESSASPNFFRKTISKAKFPFNQIKIQRIDAEGAIYESWVLNNPWISKVAFGNASYAEEKLLEVDVSFTYDWAELRDGDSGNPPPPPA
jgi:hypothetical protein